MQRIKEHIFREPNPSTRSWLALLVGCLLVPFALLYPLEHWAFRIVILLLGLTGVFAGAAEALPRSRTMLVGVLRIVYNATFLLMISLAILLILTLPG